MGINIDKGEVQGTSDDWIVTPKGDPSEAQVKSLKELEGVVTPAYVSAVKAAFPWMTGLIISRDDTSLRWVAVLDRDGSKEVCDLAGTVFPMFPDDFVKYVRKHLSKKVDRSKMEALGAALEEFDADASDKLSEFPLKSDA